MKGSDSQDWNSVCSNRKKREEAAYLWNGREVATVAAVERERTNGQRVGRTRYAAWSATGI